jgi:putative flippase GtrA
MRPPVSAADRGALSMGVSLLKHQAGALAATAVDFSVMVAMVELAGLSPVVATAIGATCGAVTNFALGRRWIFTRHDRNALGQAARYAAVSSGSLVLNTLGEAIANGVLGVRYALARAFVAVVVSLAYNFPLHRAFVFREGRA